MCAECIYHGRTYFSYAEDSTSNNTITSRIKKEAGHDDSKWTAADELLLLFLNTNYKTRDHFKQPSSLAFRALILRHFGTRYTPDECSKKLENAKRNIKTTDKCSTINFMTLKITHWDAASQQVRTTVAICDPSLLSAEDAMRFQVEATYAKNAMTELKFVESGVAKANPVNTMGFDASIVGDTSATERDTITSGWHATMGCLWPCCIPLCGIQIRTPEGPNHFREGIVCNLGGPAIINLLLSGLRPHWIKHGNEWQLHWDECGNPGQAVPFAKRKVTGPGSMQETGCVMASHVKLC